eukprot:scaffold776_cov347-Pavlova_lutheri.AAC.12
MRRLTLACVRRGEIAGKGSCGRWTSRSGAHWRLPSSEKRSSVKWRRRSALRFSDGDRSCTSGIEPVKINPPRRAFLPSTTAQVRLRRRRRDPSRTAVLLHVASWPTRALCFSNGPRGLQRDRPLPSPLDWPFRKTVKTASCFGPWVVPAWASQPLPDRSCFRKARSKQGKGAPSIRTREA